MAQVGIEGDAYEGVETDAKPLTALAGVGVEFGGESEG
jgi:hypothetical protein